MALLTKKDFETYSQGYRDEMCSLYEKFVTFKQLWVQKKKGIPLELPQEEETEPRRKFHHSSMTVKEQKQYLQLFKKFSHRNVAALSKQDKKEYNMLNQLQEKVAAEQQEFMQFFVDNPYLLTSYNLLSPEAARYMQKYLEADFQRVLHYPRHYFENDSWPSSSRVTPQEGFPLRFNRCLLQLGNVPHFVLPDFSQKCVIPIRYDKLKQTFPPVVINRPSVHPSLLPVSRDSIAEDLVKDGNVDIVLSLESFIVLANNHAPEYENEWEIPVCIRKSKESGKNVVFIDPPIPPEKITVRQRNELCFKLALSFVFAHIVKSQRRLSRGKRSGFSSNPENVPSAKIETDLFNSFETNIDDLETFGTTHKAFTKISEPLEAHESLLETSEETCIDPGSLDAVSLKCEIVNDNLTVEKDTFTIRQEDPSLNQCDDQDMKVEKTQSAQSEDYKEILSPEIAQEKAGEIAERTQEPPSKNNNLKEEKKTVQDEPCTKRYSLRKRLQKSSILQDKDFISPLRIRKGPRRKTASESSLGELDDDQPPTVVQKENVASPVKLRGSRKNAESESSKSETDDDQSLPIAQKKDIASPTRLKSPKGEVNDSQSLCRSPVRTRSALKRTLDSIPVRKELVESSPPSKKKSPDLGTTKTELARDADDDSDEDMLVIDEEILPEEEEQASPAKNMSDEEVVCDPVEVTEESPASPDKEAPYEIFSPDESEVVSVGLAPLKVYYDIEEDVVPSISNSEQENKSLGESSEKEVLNTLCTNEEEGLNEGSPVETVVVNTKSQASKKSSPPQLMTSKSKSEMSTLDKILTLQEKMLGKTRPEHAAQKLKVPEVFQDTQKAVDVKKYPPIPEAENICYNLWNLEDLSVLVRNKLDCVKPPKNEVITLVPKLEYLSLYGAECSTLTELTRQMCDLLLIPSSCILKARINAHNEEILMTEMIGWREFELIGSRIKPVVLLSQIAQLFRNLKTIDPGNYILIHKPGEDKIHLYKATEEKKRGTFDLHTAVNQRMVLNTAITTSLQTSMPLPPVVPLDPGVMLPCLVKMGRVPLTFPPKGFKAPQSKRRPKRKGSN